jgi:hypothetical protein
VYTVVDANRPVGKRKQTTRKLPNERVKRGETRVKVETRVREK